MRLRQMIATKANQLDRRLARSRQVARGAALLRNQCELVIGYHFAPTSDPAGNGERWLVEQVGPAVERFIDVGANVGDWTMMLLGRNPAAVGIAIEPGLAALDALRARVPGSVQIVSAAAGADEMGMTFFEQPRAGEHSSTFAGWAGGDCGRSVPSVTVDGVLEASGWATTDFLKIDVEGYDANVLDGAQKSLRSQRIEIVQFEYNRPWRQAGNTLARALAMLDTAGYDVYVLRASGLERYDYAVFGEFFSYANFVAVRRSSSIRQALRCP